MEVIVLALTKKLEINNIKINWSVIKPKEKRGRAT